MSDEPAPKKRFTHRHALTATGLIGLLTTAGGVRAYVKGDNAETATAVIAAKQARTEQDVAALQLRVDGGIERLSDRLGRVETDMAVVKSNTRLIMKALRVKVDE